MNALLEYLDLTALLEYINLLNRYSGGPSWGLLGPLSGWGPGKNAPVAPPPPPPWAVLPLAKPIRCCYLQLIYYCMTELQSFYPSAILGDGLVPYHVMQKSESSFNSTGSSHFMFYTMNRLLTPQQVVFLLCNALWRLC